MQKRHVLVCEDSLCPRELPDLSGPGLGEAGRFRYPIGFRVSAGFGFGDGFSPNWYSGRVRVLSSGFGFWCPDTPPDPNPTPHPYLFIVLRRLVNGTCVHFRPIKQLE